MMSGLFEQSKARSRGTGALPGPAPFASFRYNCERHDFFLFFFSMDLLKFESRSRLLLLVRTSNPPSAAAREITPQ